MDNTLCLVVGSFNTSHIFSPDGIRRLFQTTDKTCLQIFMAGHVYNSVNHKSLRPHYKDNIVYHLQYQIYHIPSI